MPDATRTAAEVCKARHVSEAPARLDLPPPNTEHRTPDLQMPDTHDTHDTHNLILHLALRNNTLACHLRLPPLRHEPAAPPLSGALPETTAPGPASHCLRPRP